MVFGKDYVFTFICIFFDLIYFNHHGDLKKPIMPWWHIYIYKFTYIPLYINKLLFHYQTKRTFKS